MTVELRPQVMCIIAKTGLDPTLCGNKTIGREIPNIWQYMETQHKSNECD